LRIRQSLVILAGILISASHLSAQDGKGIVRVRAISFEGIPIGGALVALISPDGKVAAEGLTDDTGFRSLGATNGPYSVRIRRIGYEPFLSPQISVPYDGELKLAVTGRHVSLETVVVTAGSQCKQAGIDQRTIGGLWEEISKALVGTQLTRNDVSNLGWARVYRKQVKLSGEVLSFDTTRTMISDARPFAASDPRILASKGFVVGDMYSGWRYFAPDEAVLLSSDFADTHCFRVVREKNRTGQVGVNFEPAPGRKVGEIAGVLWLDEQSAELREIVFRFVNIGELNQFKPGGAVHFRRMSSGAWIVDDWHLRLPVIEMKVDGLRSWLVQSGFVENGGAIVEK
jgi:hypothetical protein